MIRTRRFVRLLQQSRARLVPITLALLLISAAGLTAERFYFDYWPDRQTDSSAARNAIRAASEGGVALLSYSPETLSRDVDNARSRVTDDFRASYQQFTEQIVAPAAQRAQLTTTVRVVRAAAAELHPNSAVVLAFIEQDTASKTNPEHVKTSSSVRITLKNVHGVWLIDKLDVL